MILLSSHTHSPSPQPPARHGWTSIRLHKHSQPIDAILPPSCMQHEAVLPPSCMQHEAVLPPSCMQHEAVLPPSCMQHEAVLPPSCMQYEAVRHHLPHFLFSPVPPLPSTSTLTLISTLPSPPHTPHLPIPPNPTPPLTLVLPLESPEGGVAHPSPSPSPRSHQGTAGVGRRAGLGHKQPLSAGQP